MKAEYVNPFLNGTVNVLKTMAFVDPKPGKPYVKKDKKAVGDISGVIGLTGSTRGAVVVSFSRECAMKVVSSMMGEQYADLTDEVRDAVGEITNMVSGDARRALAELGANFEAGIPTVVVGKGHEITTMGQGPCLAIPFKIDGHDLTVEISFE